MTTWPTVQLREVLTQVERPEAIDAEKTYRLLGVRWYGQGLFVREVKLGAEIAATRAYAVKAGDFVYNRLFAWKGSFAVAGADSDGAYVSNEFPSFACDSSRLDAAFLLSFFRDSRVWTKAFGLSTGGTPTSRNRLKEAAFLAMEFPLPPLDEQRRIVARIDELMTRIGEAQTLGNEVADETSGVLVSMAHRRDLGDAAKESAGWRHLRLGDCIRFDGHLEKVHADRIYPNLGIYSFGRGLFRKPPIDGALTSATTLRGVKAGQFIYSRLFAFEGAYGWVSADYDGHFVSSEYPTFHCNQDVLRAEFLAAYFKAPPIWAQVARGSKGLGDRRRRVQPEQLLAHRLWIPPLETQDRIAEFQQAREDVTRLRLEAALELKALSRAVLDRAFRGAL